MGAATGRGTKAPEDATALEFGRRNAAKMFEGRKGHGGGPCSYRTLREGDLAELLAAAFAAGCRHGAGGKGPA